MLREGRGQTHWNHNHRKLTNLITQTTALSNSMKLSHAVSGNPRHKGLGGEFWQNVVHWRRANLLQMANHFSILALRTPWTVWKGKKIGHRKMNSPDWKVPNMLLEKSGEIIPERTKRQSQSENNAQLWMWLVTEVKFDAIKNNTAYEPGMLGPWIKVN